MMPSHRLIVTLLLLVFFIIPYGGRFTRLNANNNPEARTLDQATSVPDELGMKDESIVAADTHSGVLNPVVVEQYGYSGTGHVNARTDSGVNDEKSIPIDNATGWVGSNAELEIQNMKRLYAENGTFDDGVDGTTYYPDSVVGYPYGWDFDWDDPSYGPPPGEQNLSTTYDKDSGYIVLQTEGQLDTSSGYVEYRHYDGTFIYWNQVIHNAPYSDNLTLSFMYNYVSGIIDKFEVIEGYFWLDVLIDGVFVGYIDLHTECPARNTWYEFVVSNITNTPETFNLEIGISHMTWYISDNYYITNPGGDYDDNGVLDFDYTRVNTVLLDNVTLESVVQPSYEAVNLTFNAGTFSTAITEFSNYGTAIISNPSYWTDSVLSVGISANVSISCDYEVNLLSHNYGDSLWASQPTKKGVAYTIDAGVSASLSAFTYVGNEGVAIYENFTVVLYLPPDWENVTVFDPFLNDVTGLCAFSPGSLEIPTSILDRLGWWQLTLDSPNYAKSFKTQIHDTTWEDGTLLRPGNMTRVSLTLGTASETPIVSDPVNVTWFTPAGATWSTDSTATGVGGIVNSTQRTLGGLNTSAGLWSVIAVWTNGTEIAYGSTSFDMYHTAALVVPGAYTTVQTDVGQIISNFVYYTDADTSDYLLDDSVTITANWSGSVVPFTQDLVKNWWRGEFDTSLVEGGQYTVVVTASRPYFDDISTQFVVVATQQTALEILNVGAIPIERGLNEVFTLQLSYQLLNGSEVKGAFPTIVFTGPQEGLSWTNFVDNNTGLYSLDISCNVSAIYGITVSLSKIYHYNTSKSFTLIIGETGSELDLLNGTADVGLFGDSYRLVVEYKNSTGSGLSGANLQVVTVTPAIGLIYTNFSHIVDGYYQITLTPTAAGSFSIVISASIINHETKYATFTLTATGIPTILTSLPSSASTALDQSFTVQLRFQDDTLNPLDLANFTVTITPSGLNISDVVRLGGGIYNFTLTPLELGTFTVLFRSSLDNYQSSSTAFTLIVTKVPTLIAFEGDLSSVNVGFEENYQLVIYYYRTDIGIPVNVAGASISVITQDPGLEIEMSENPGYYVIAIRGHSIGTWSLTISANKTNHHVATKQFLFTVERVPISVEILEGNGGLELLSTALRVNITETDTGNPVSGLNVFYRIIIGTPNGFAEDPVSLTESITPGVYVASITMPDADEVYYIQISCESENFVLDEPLLTQLAITRSFTTALMLYSTRYWWAILGIVAIVGAVGYRRTARRRRVKQNKIALAVKKRFDDVRSLLGVIVLHKDSGLPVYSKILREGLEESVISAFISAITSFRGEFDIETTTEEWGLIPISDIIRVISTNKLICAFITTGNPSAEQREKMIQFAKTVGFIFDETMEDVPVVILDQHTTRQFNSLFDDILDGALLRTYKLDEVKKFPTSTCADERIARKQGEEFKLEELASEIAACGLEEGRVYQAIMKALENHLLVTTDESPFKTEIIRAPDIVEEES